MATRLGRVMTYNVEFPFIKLYECFMNLILWGHVANWILYLHTCTKPVTTKHGKIVIYDEGLSLIKSHEPLNIYSNFFDVTWQSKNIISPLAEDPWSAISASHWLTVRVSMMEYPTLKVKWSLDHVTNEQSFEKTYYHDGLKSVREFKTQTLKSPTSC